MKDQIRKRIKKFYLATAKYEEQNEKRADYILKPFSEANFSIVPIGSAPVLRMNVNGVLKSVPRKISSIGEVTGEM